MRTISKTTRRKPVYFTPRAPYAGRLAHYSAAHRRTPGDLSQRWAEERIDMMDFPHIEFRDSKHGSFAYIRGTGLAVWQVAQLAKAHGWGKALCKHLEVEADLIASAKGYYDRHGEEIDALVESNEAATFESAQAILPNLKQLDEIPARS